MYALSALGGEKKNYFKSKTSNHTETGKETTQKD